MKIKNIIRHKFSGVVHNISVEDDESFTANGVKVKNCRGIWVSILTDEEDLPPIGGVPASLRARTGDTVNDLIQPKTPITPKDSPAQKEIDKREKKAEK